MISREELGSWLALVYSPGWSARLVLNWVAKLGSATAVLRMTQSLLKSQLTKGGLTPELLDARLPLTHSAVVEALAWSEQPGHSIIASNDPRYPPRLQAINSPPPLLFVRGNPACLQAPQIALVGSRNPTAAGLAAAAQLSYELVQQGLVITSGLARGIDGAAHRAALAGRGQTIAVLGSGLNQLYPAAHKQLALEITQQGALVSEFALNEPPRAAYFPQRNRIISGLSVGVVVVEATLHSGSLITARLANEQGREVFALPGALTNPLARGCHVLIQQGAKLVTQVTDILEEIRPQLPDSCWQPINPQPGIAIEIEQVTQPAAAETTLLARPSKASRPIDMPASLSPRQQTVLAAVDYAVTPVDLIVERCQLPIAQILSILTSLELAGVVQPVAGGFSR